LDHFHFVHTQQSFLWQFVRNLIGTFVCKEKIVYVKFKVKNYILICQVCTKNEAGNRNATSNFDPQFFICDQAMITRLNKKRGHITSDIKLMPRN
jgi:hypothetical protein